MHSTSIRMQASVVPKASSMSLVKRGKMAVKSQAISHTTFSSRKALAARYESSDNENDGDDEEYYFSDASVTSTSSRCSWSSSSSSSSSTSSCSQSHQMGDFVFDDEDFAQYFDQMRVSTHFRSTTEKARRASEPSSVPMQRTRKVSSAFFLSGNRMASLPRLSYSEPSNTDHVTPSLYRSRPTRAAGFAKQSKQADSSSDEESSFKAVALAEANYDGEDQDFHRALMFASFHQSKQGHWQAPEGVNKTLLQLVASLR